MNDQPSLSAGVAVIRQALKHMPSSPGVYRMIDCHDVVLYVGKARKLPKRVASYTRPERLPYRTQAMIAKTSRMEFTITETESQALLLEANLIKCLNPKYNILLKDDKTYPHILITQNHDYPRIVKHRGKQTTKGQYFGPFSAAGAVNKTINDIQKAFLLRPCSDSFFASRKRPCMEYQIKRCSAPCVDKISKDDYHNLVKQALAFMKGQHQTVQKQLSLQMEHASASMDYEKAALLRDRIVSLNQIQSQHQQQDLGIKDADFIALIHEGDIGLVSVSIFRHGQFYGEESFELTHTEHAKTQEVFEHFMVQFYQQRTPPHQIFLQRNFKDHLVEDAIKAIAPHAISFAYPQKGNKYHLLTNMLAKLDQQLGEKKRKRLKHHEYLINVAKIFELNTTPARIEVYDNSHLMGTNEYGAMIVVDHEGFQKKAYRKYSIKGDAKAKGDDYGMMREVMARRFKHHITGDTSDMVLPDLVLIDGGIGQLNVVYELLQGMGIDVPLVAISKGPNRNAGRETFHQIGKDSFTLPIDDPTLYFLQNIRDEAHRFAIGSHRKKRGKSMSKSSLDDVPNIGAKRKKQLLQFFGSFDAIKKASASELAQVDGISDTLAQQLSEYFSL